MTTQERYQVSAKTEHPLLDQIRTEYDLNSDAELGEFLEMTAPTLSRIRTGQIPISPLTILRIYDATSWSIEKIRSLIPPSQK